MAFYDQGSGGAWPMIVLTGDGGSYPGNDSAMIYRWGMLADSFRARSGIYGRKAEVETLKTALCGLRTFGNSGLNTCDTIIVLGVAESTTVATANYAGGFESATCTALRIKVATDSIIVKRGATTDPDRYYWQATKMLGPGQIAGPKDPLPDGRTLGFSVYPNPSTGLVTASYGLSQPGPVELGVYNMLGQKVKTIKNEWQPAGYYTVQWDGKNDQGRKAAAGVYLYQLKAAGCQETKKMVLVK
ncbi:MAG: FlgD immunoglobulin-like domain containing protein [bacterium]|nr:FlgD immunoglobulin-like domain containing protein [bacterium]